MTTPNTGKSGMAFLAAITVAIAMASTGAIAQEKSLDQNRDRTQLRTQDSIYGSQLMTPAERNTHRAMLRKMTTEQERENYRADHHQKMQDRASARGITLPAVPPMVGVGGGTGNQGGAGGRAEKK